MRRSQPTKSWGRGFQPERREIAKNPGQEKLVLSRNREEASVAGMWRMRREAFGIRSSRPPSRGQRPGFCLKCNAKTLKIFMISFTNLKDYTVLLISRFEEG